MRLVHLKHNAQLSVCQRVFSRRQSRDPERKAYLAAKSFANVAAESSEVQQLTPRARLALIDGHCLVLRACFASHRSELQNRNGIPTGVLWFFTRTLLRLQNRYSHLAVMFDAGGPEQLLRRQLFPGYKGRRLEVPWMPKHSEATYMRVEEQVESCRRACDTFRVPHRQVKGYEADDLIATYVREAAGNYGVHIFTADKDLMQLVSPNVQIHTSTNFILDAKQVEEKWGVPPRLVGDLLALAGDASDSVPGVPGIGPRRAAALLQQYGCLSEVLKASESDELKMRGLGSKLRGAVREHADRARLMRKVVELENVPQIDASELHTQFCVQNFDRDAAASFCADHDFRSLLPVINGTPRVHGNIPMLVQKPVQEDIRAYEIENLETAKRAMTVFDKAARNMTEQVFAVHVTCQPHVSIAVFGDPPLKNEGALCWMHISCNLSQGSLVDVLKPFFQTSQFKKVYHNFSDCCRILFSKGLLELDHVIYPSSVGLKGDVMHMARLWDPSLAYFSQDDSLYSINFLRRHILDAKGAQKNRLTTQQSAVYNESPNQVELECLKGKTVLELWKTLKGDLMARPWEIQGSQNIPETLRHKSMWDFYDKYWRPFGELLAKMEITGIPVDKATLEGMIQEARSKNVELECQFRSWAEKRLQAAHGHGAVEDWNIKFMNVNSTSQLRHLFFGSADDDPLEFTGMPLPAGRFTCAERSCRGGDNNMQHVQDGGILSRAELETLNENQLQELCDLLGVRVAARQAKMRERIIDMQFENLYSKTLSELRVSCLDMGLKLNGTKGDLASRILDPDAPESTSKKSPARARVKLRGLGISPLREYLTKSGAPSVSTDALRALLRKRSSELQEDGAEAIRNLLVLAGVEASLSGFLKPLHKAIECTPDGAHHRIRPSLNINTETGRLSCRRPNLQNLPVGVGDAFPVRSAIAAPSGRMFIIADYEQLELRVVAHLAGCVAMTKLLNSGEDIHAQTACKMFAHVKEKVDSGEVQMRDLKQMFPEERSRAKTLNFGVLYGISSFRLAQDWAIPESQAQEIINKWFDAFPAVKTWKAEIERSDGEDGVRTLLGRVRPLRDLGSPQRHRRNHAQRAAVNTVAQGSAADIVTLAMLKLRRSIVLQKLDFHQVLQVHDEIILEGPDEHKEKAKEKVVSIMEDPLPFSLDVKLKVNVKQSDRWEPLPSWWRV